MTVGLGTGSTVAHLLPALAARGLGIRCVATSPATARRGARAGPRRRGVRRARAARHRDRRRRPGRRPTRWLIKGGGGAHLREKVVAAAADRFVVIADSSKPVEALRPPVPLELFAFGAAATIARLRELGKSRLRDAPPSPDGGLIADLHCDLGDPGRLAADLDADPGVAAHGLFPPAWSASADRRRR